jgi:uncharacterized protein (TIGR02145 family)
MEKGATDFSLDPNTPGLENFRDLHFRCILDGAEKSNTFIIRFIRTNTSGYGESNGVRYLAINRSPEGGAASGNPNTIRMALLNVGASATDGIGLGNLFQWGRMRDGHELINWAKRSTYVNWFDPVTAANVAARPATVDGTHYNTSTGQLLLTSPLRSTFLTTSHGTVRNWSIDGNAAPVDRLWGDGSTARPGTGWTFGHNNPQDNHNPCPAGWRIPTRWEFGDIYRASGTNNPPGSDGFSPLVPFLSGNRWEWRSETNTGEFTGIQVGTVGGALVTNQNNEVLFFPAVGWRTHTTGGNITNVGHSGVYWSSTFNGGVSGDNDSFALTFTATNVQAGSTSSATARASGLSVRCVVE